MAWVPDAVLRHLQWVMDAPELNGTRYELIEAIGRGGMGTVYRARDTQLDREVALKVLSEADSDGSLAARMRGEARILAKLEHPGIVPVHDAGLLPDGRTFYAMRRVEGLRLDKYSREATGLSERLRIFLKICEPVAFAHANGVLHRDLKPENVILGKFGEVFVLDWGVATLRGQCEAEGTVVGTVEYMAPEQAAGKVRCVDERSDVFALGRMLAFLTRGMRVPKPLEAIIRKATSPAPEARYSNVVELETDIGRFLDSQPVSAYQERPWEVVARWLRRNKALMALVAAYLVMRALVLIFAGR